MANFCKSCGSQLSPSDTNCPTCGEPVSGASFDNPYGQYNYANQSSAGAQPDQGYQNYNSQPYAYSQPYGQQGSATSVAGWIGWMLLCSILPIIGQIIIIVSARDESLKNYAKATLIMSAIAVVLSIIFMALFGTAFASQMSNMS